MSKDYELTLIVDSQLVEGNADEVVKRYESLLGERGATVVQVDRWGIRKLAYEIRKRQQGDYTLFQFQAEPGAIAEIERACRLDESLLRHLIIHAENGFLKAVATGEGAPDISEGNGVSEDTSEDEVSEEEEEA